jgi:hypothetical protein
MTRKEAIRQTRQSDTLQSLGFTLTEAERLRRISMTLRSWHERECGTGNGCIERDEETGKTFWLSSMSGRRFPIRDMETGARKRLAGIISARNQRVLAPLPEAATLTGDIAQAFDHIVSAYVQTDPRGCALYILRPGDVPAGADADSYYWRGIAVY